MVPSVSMYHEETCIHLTNPTCERTLGIAWQDKHYLSQAAQAFRQFVMEYFANLE